MSLDRNCLLDYGTCGMAQREKYSILPLFHLFGEKHKPFQEPLPLQDDDEAKEVSQMIGSYHSATFGLGLRMDRRSIATMIDNLKEERRQKNEEEGRITPVGLVEAV